MLQENRDAKGAAVEFESAAALMQPGDSALPDVLLKLGAAWLAAGDTGKAAEAWERTVALDPKNFELHRRLAENYIAGNLPDIFLQLAEVGNDVDVRGNTRTGSILIENLTIAGE